MCFFPGWSSQAVPNYESVGIIFWFRGSIPTGHVLLSGSSPILLLHVDMSNFWPAQNAYPPLFLANPHSCCWPQKGCKPAEPGFAWHCGRQLSKVAPVDESDLLSFQLVLKESRTKPHSSAPCSSIDIVSSLILISSDLICIYIYICICIDSIIMHSITEHVLVSIIVIVVFLDQFISTITMTITIFSCVYVYTCKVICVYIYTPIYV